jgi:spore coat protein U-like protein
MKTRTRKLIHGLMRLSTLAPQLATGLAQGTAFTYQGRLNDGANPASGIYDLRFTRYDAAGEGSQQGPTLTNAAAAVSNGLFTVTLDFGAGVFTGAARWWTGSFISSRPPRAEQLINSKNGGNS